MFALLFDLEDYATTYRATRDAYLKAANELKLATGPYKAPVTPTSRPPPPTPSPSTSKFAARGDLVPVRLPSFGATRAGANINYKNKSKKRVPAWCGVCGSTPQDLSIYLALPGFTLITAVHAARIQQMYGYTALD